MPRLGRALISGAAAGAVGGLLLIWAILARGAMAGMMLAPGAAARALFEFGLGIAAGGIFGLLSGDRPFSYPTSLSAGVLFGLLWWIAGPLTVVPLLAGAGPFWSLNEAAAAFPALIGYLLYGAVLGITYQAVSALTARLRPETASVVASAGTVQQTPRRHLVILGGGFGGVSAAQRLEQLLLRDRTVEITLISQSNYLLFTPMLAEVAGSGLEPQHISAPVRAALQRTQFRRAAVDAIDPVGRTVGLRRGTLLETLPYDHLILALGSVPNFYGLPGLADHAFTLKTLEDASTLRNHVIALLERADGERDPGERRRLLTFVVAGGGFAGTELVAELRDLVRSVLRFYPGIGQDEPRFILVHSQPRILPELSEALGDYALARLRARGIEFLLERRVAGMTGEVVRLTDGAEVSTRTLVWTAGNQPHPLLSTLACERNRAGAVIVDGTLHVKGLEDVWAVGDCAEVPDLLQGGKSCPPTAQHAMREGKTVADNVVATMRGRPPKPFRFRTLAVLVGLGHRTAVAEVRGVRFSGLLAWFMWRTIYLTKLPGLEKKLRVAIDWTIDLFFPRDIALGTAEAPTLPQLLGAPSADTEADVARQQSPAP